MQAAARVSEIAVASKVDVLAELSSAVALRIKHALSPAECDAFVRGVYAGKSDWTHNFQGIQFTLGRAWYTHLETDLTDAYFANAAASDALVEKHCPGLAKKMMALASSLLSENVVRRPGYCGPGVHVFPANGYCSSHGGDLHFDTEGLTRAQLRANVRAVTFVLMMQPAKKGGGLVVWDAKFEGTDEVTEAQKNKPRAVIDYQAGELVVIDSYSLHQIQTFEGDADRISATCHAMKMPSGEWQLWF